MSHQERKPSVSEYHDEETLFKTRNALREANLTETQIDDAISSMQNYGILFRERVDPSVARLFQ